MDKTKIGKILWCDLTVGDSKRVSEFYQSVVGWEKTGISMGEYEDYLMKAPNTDEGISGICLAEGPNKYLPAQWLIYVGVENLDESLKRCEELGGKVLGGKRKMGDDFYCLIQDPAGAYMMLYNA